MHHPVPGWEMPLVLLIHPRSPVRTQSCLCVILYLYPATCSPKGHGSGSAAAEAVGSSCFTYNLFHGTRPALPVIVGPPTTSKERQKKSHPRKGKQEKPRPILSPNMLHDWPGAHSSSPMASPAPTRASPPPPSPPVLSSGLEVCLLGAPHPSRPGGGVSHPPAKWPIGHPILLTRCGCVCVGIVIGRGRQRQRNGSGEARGEVGGWSLHYSDIISGSTLQNLHKIFTECSQDLYSIFAESARYLHKIFH